MRRITSCLSRGRTIPEAETRVETGASRSAVARHGAPAVVLDLGPSGLEVCRALGRRGVPVLGMDRRLGIAAKSRYCRALLSGDPRAEPAEVCRTLIELARKQTEWPVIMPLSDEWATFLSRHRAALVDHYRFVLPPAQVMESLTDKLRSYELARRHSIKVPKHDVVETADDLHRAAANIGYPCVLKPARSSDWAQPKARSTVGARKIVRADDARALALAYEQARPFAQRHVLEELIPGPDTSNYYVVCYIDSGGTPRAEFVHQKILMRPPGRGVGCLIESVHDEHLASMTTGFLQAVGHVGLAGIEYKRDPRDGRWKLLDLNPRWGQGDSLAAICGPDMAWLYYCDSLGAKLQDAGGYRSGVKWVQLRSYLRSAVAVQREQGVNLVRTLLSLRGELHHSVLAWDDLGPTAWVVGDILGGRVLRRRRGSPPGAASDGQTAPEHMQANGHRSNGG